METFIEKNIGETVTKLGPNLYFAPEKNIYIEIKRKSGQAKEETMTKEELIEILGPRGDYGMSAWCN